MGFRWPAVVANNGFQEDSIMLLESVVSELKSLNFYISQDKYESGGAPENPENKWDAVDLADGESLDSYTEILSIQQCELLLHDKEGAPKVVGMGRVHPNPEKIIHNSPMKDGLVEVQVDRVVEGCESTRLLPESCVLNEIECMEDAKGGFIQWPVKLVKILNKDSHQSVESSHQSTTTVYRPRIFFTI